MISEKIFHSNQLQKSNALKKEHKINYFFLFFIILIPTHPQVPLAMFYNHSSVRQMSIKFFEISNCIFVYVFKQTREALYTFIYSTEYNKPLNTSIGHIQTTHLKLFKITRKINNQQSTRLLFSSCNQNYFQYYK